MPQADIHDMLCNVSLEPCLCLFEALTCSRREDGLSCQHSVKPPLTHSLCLATTLWSSISALSLQYLSVPRGFSLLGSIMRVPRSTSCPMIHNSPATANRVLPYMCRVCINFEVWTTPTYPFKPFGVNPNGVECSFHECSFLLIEIKYACLVFIIWPSLYS